MNPARVTSPRWASSGVFIAISVLLVGLIASTAAAGAVQTNAHKAATEMMNRRTELVQRAVTAEAQRSLDATRLVAGGLSGHTDIGIDEFRQATEPLGKMDLSGSTGVVFVVAASDGQVGDTETYWRDHGVPELKLQPQGTGRTHYFGVFRQSFDGDKSAPTGTDISQAAAPAQALVEAQRSGQVAVSDTYLLLKDRTLPTNQQQLSFVFAAPVYGVPSASGDKVFRGWVLMGLRGQNFVGSTLTDVSQGLTDVKLSARNADGTLVTVASLTSDASGKRDMHRSFDVSIAQRLWTVQVSGVASNMPGGSSQLALVTLLLGIVLSFLIAALVSVLATARVRAEVRVKVATADLAAVSEQAQSHAVLLSAVMASIADGVGVIDENWNFLMHNPAARELLGIRNSARPTDWEADLELLRADGVTPFPFEEMPLSRALAGESVNKAEMFVRHRDRPEGTLIEVNAQPLDPSSGRRAAVAVFRDVTVVRQQENELRSFAGVVAHDLKSPLTVVGGYSEILDEYLSAAMDAESYGRATTTIQRIRSGVARMQRLIDDLLAYTSARDAALSMSTVDLNEVVSDVVAIRLQECTSDGKTQMPHIYVGELPRVTGDPVLLRQVLDNLIGNAIKYSQLDQAAHIDISAGQGRSGWIRIEISDRGIGIPVGQHKAIFGGFHRAHVDSGYAGTGLGLAICKRAIERHGGEIGVLPNPGGGSRFYFTVQVAEDEQASVAGTTGSAALSAPAIQE